MQSSGSNPNIVITSTSSKWWMIWKMDGAFIRNVKDGRVVEVEGSKDAEGTNIKANKKNGGTNQQWRLLYLKDKKEDKTNFNMGFKVDEPFYFISRMPMKRCIGGTSYVYLQKITKAKTQQWRFDQKTKTIKSVQYTSYSLHIYSNGNGPYVQITTTNARWF
jgi:hypothetical protein